ncbi:hypothetical protein AOT82_1552 [Psychrobacter sp. AntiMn-1]|nr:hypothetical protein AOT82_1552 [Psychrobacter sp. AntiMn-1]
MLAVLAQTEAAKIDISSTLSFLRYFDYTTTAPIKNRPS